MSVKVEFEVPDIVSVALKIGADRLADELRMTAAVKLYEMKRLSSGKAAELAGIPRAAFLQKLGEYGVATFDLSKDDLTEDARSLAEAR